MGSVAAMNISSTNSFKSISINDTVYYVQEQRRINSFISNMAQRFTIRKQNRVWDEWMCSVDDSLKLKQTARKVIRHLMNRALAGAFNTWWYNADRRRQNAQRALRVVQRLRNRAQVNTLESWVFYADENQRLKECYASAVRIINRGILAWSLEEWSCNAFNNAELRRRHQQLRLKVIRQIQNLLLIVCWERWCANVERKTRVRVCPGCWIWVPSNWISAQ